LRTLLIIFTLAYISYELAKVSFLPIQGIDRAEIEQVKALIDFDKKYQSTLREIQDIGADDSLSILIYDKSIKYGFDPLLTARLIKIESNFDPYAISYVGAMGLTQTMPSTCRLYGLDCTFEPERNIDNGLYILWDKLKQYKTIEKALLSYNGGAAGVKHRFNQTYADNIMGNKDERN
jgi:soluble lytic murein transglycosylase-like protein